MKENILKTKNFIITDLGEVGYGEPGDFLSQYMVRVKNIDCSDILFKFDGNDLVSVMAWEQNNYSIEGKQLTDFTHKIAKLIENDVIDVVKFLNRHLY